MYNILNHRELQQTKDGAKILTVIIIGFLLILAGVYIKYEPVYEVTIAGKRVGYIKDKENFEQEILEKIINKTGKNIDNVYIEEMPKYEYKLLNRKIGTNEEEIFQNIEERSVITYKYYYVSCNNEIKAYVDTFEDAMEVVTNIEQNYSNQGIELNLQVFEKYTQIKEEVKTDSIEVAESTIENIAEQIKKEKEEEELEKKKLEEQNKALAIINDIKISVLPVNGRITSRYGESSSLRKSTHTGLDIACATGTDIKAVSSGTVVFASRNGSYGNLVKINHGNGVETWYAHCSKIYTKVGAKVEAGDIIAAVGSTGNSTGPHLHLEIRINGNAVNPQNYVY